MSAAIDETAVVIICEGYHDRAFWSGLLTNLAGFEKPVAGQRVTDPAGNQVRGGQFGFRSANSGRYAEIVPARSASKLLQTFDVQLKRSRRINARQVIYNYDPDALETGAADRLATLRDRATRAKFAVSKYDETALQFTTKSEDEHETLVSVCPWACETPSEISEEVRAGLPEKQTLERLICVAYATRRPDRVTSAASWLADEPPRSAPHSAKSEAFSLMAKWHPIDGPERFYESLWEEEQTRQSLTELLKASEAWLAISRLLGEDGTGSS